MESSFELSRELPSPTVQFIAKLCIRIGVDSCFVSHLKPASQHDVLDDSNKNRRTYLLLFRFSALRVRLKLNLSSWRPLRIESIWQNPLGVKGQTELRVTKVKWRVEFSPLYISIFFFWMAQLPWKASTNKERARQKKMLFCCSFCYLR